MGDDRRGWWGRNWKWAAPSGCLLVIVLFVGGCVALFAGLFGMVKNTGAYTIAIERLQQDPAAIAALGQPIETGWGFDGGFNDQGDTGDAHYSQSVHGPRGAGTLYVEAIKREGRWRFRVLRLVPEDDAPAIDLRTPAEVREFGDTEYEGGVGRSEGDSSHA